MKHNFFGLIPSRKGSKGIINKNMQIIGQKPMIQFTMEAAINASSLDSFILSSDDEKAISLAQELGVHSPFIRPNYLCLDSSSIQDVIDHALKWYEINYRLLPENIILLQPTSPFRTAQDVDEAIGIFSKSPKKRLVSVAEPTQHPGDFLIRKKNGSLSRFELDLISDKASGRHAYPETFFIDGGIYIINTVEFLDSHDLIGNDPEIILLPKNHAVDIDTIFDLDIARAVYNSQHFKE
jgi:CMP-N,N'-diacetyllegionaminic acid synthase